MASTRTPSPHRTDVEAVSKQDLERGLNTATRNSRPKGAYRKGRDSFAILADLDPDTIANASPHAKRFLETLRAWAS